MRGVAFTGVIDAVAIGVALWIIGVPLVIPLAVLTFLGAFFPIVGATVAGAIATLVALVTNGPRDAILIALVTLAVQQLEGDLIMPLVMQRQVHLHPVVVLVALASGGALAGLVGAFVAVPVAAMITGATGALREIEVLGEIDEPDPPG
jgi:predicted PurR-regulated permease PerM